MRRILLHRSEAALTGLKLVAAACLLTGAVAASGGCARMAGAGLEQYGRNTGDPGRAKAGALLNNVLRGAARDRAIKDSD